MSNAERYWAVGAGAVGLIALIGGSFLAALPAPDRASESVQESLRARRRAVLTGSLLTATAGVLLIWPVTAVATYDPDTWASLSILSVGLAVTGAGVFFLAGLAVATVAWAERDHGTSRALLDAAHLAMWGLSAPMGALLTVVVTAAGVQGDLLGPFVVVAAIAKVVTVVIEVAGLGRRDGWNAGGWAGGSSGYVTVLWYALVLIALA